MFVDQKDDQIDLRREIVTVKIILAGKVVSTLQNFKFGLILEISRSTQLGQVFETCLSILGKRYLRSSWIDKIYLYPYPETYPRLRNVCTEAEM